MGGAVGKGSIELIEQVLGVEEPAAVSGEDGLAKETYGKAGFARTGIADKDDILSSFHKGKTGEGLNLRAVEVGLALEGKGLESPSPGDLRLLEAMIEAPFLPVALLFRKSR